MRKKFLCLLAMLSICLFSACSDSSGGSVAKDIREKETPNFSQAINIQCDKIDQPTINSIFSGDSWDPAISDGIFQKAEDEFDRLIGNLTDATPSEKNQDDWDTFLDDMSAIRDSFPNLAKYLKEIDTLSNSYIGETQEDVQNDIQDQITEQQSQYEAVMEDLQHRADEISSISKRLKIKSCDIIPTNG